MKTSFLFCFQSTVILQFDATILRTPDFMDFALQGMPILE